MARYTSLQCYKAIFFTIIVTSFVLLNIFEMIRDQLIIREKYARALGLSDDQNQIDSSRYPKAQSFDRKDWHDYEFILYEASRKGNGEQGQGYNLEDPEDIEINNKYVPREGFHVIVSDKISVNRSLHDTRPNE
jgi:hypothetical protein